MELELSCVNQSKSGADAGTDRTLIGSPIYPFDLNRDVVAPGLALGRFRLSCVAGPEPFEEPRSLDQGRRDFPAEDDRGLIGSREELTGGATGCGWPSAISSLMPINRSMALRSPRSSGVQNESAMPSAPARPVRPMRWT